MQPWKALVRIVFCADGLLAMTDLASGAKPLSKRAWWIALPTVGGLLLIVVVSLAMSSDDRIPIQSATVVASYPHDAGAFTQGLVIDQGTLFEGTGQYGQSTLRRVDLETGRVEKSMSLASDYFGEGITLMGEQIFQLTWKEGVCFLYDKQTLAPTGTLRYVGDGWGLTNDGQHLYLSDGSSNIHVLDPKNLKRIRRIRVKQGRRAIDQLNELEFVEGEIYANIWHSDQIARIDPISGDVLGWIDCSQVYPVSSRQDREQVLNGIAYDSVAKRLFITGKNWPRLFEIQVPK